MIFDITPMKKTVNIGAYSGVCSCPNDDCKKAFREYSNFCPDCGQSLDWSEWFDRGGKTYGVIRHMSGKMEVHNMNFDRFKVQGVVKDTDGKGIGAINSGETIEGWLIIYPDYPHPTICTTHTVPNGNGVATHFYSVTVDPATIEPVRVKAVVDKYGRKACPNSDCSEPVSFQKQVHCHICGQAFDWEVE